MAEASGPGVGVTVHGDSCQWGWCRGAFVCALTFSGSDSRSEVRTGLCGLRFRLDQTWPPASDPWPGFPSTLQQLPPLGKILPPLPLVTVSFRVFLPWLFCFISMETELEDATELSSWLNRSEAQRH